MKMNRYIIPVLVMLAFFPAAGRADGDTATVLYVIDGDTIKVMYGGRRESVRLIGIDAPESRKNGKALKDSARSGNDVAAIVSQGKEAKKYVRGLVGKGDTVRIEFDAEKRDRYRRLLGYVYLADGRMLNDLVIRNGYAAPLTIPPNVKHRSRFSESYKYAREHGLGLWR